MTVAYLLLSCSDVPRVTNLTRDWVFKLAAHAGQYFVDMSGGRELMEFRVFDWFPLPVTSQQWNSWLFDAGDHVVPMVAAGLQVDLSPYDHFVLVIDKEDAHLGATRPTDRKYTNVAAADLTAAILCHELGHQYGSNHAKLALPDGIDEYGDNFCIMGAEGAKFSYNEPALNFPNTVGQANWRYCVHCFELFYNGYPTKGVCPGLPARGRIGGSRGHRASADIYLVPHDVQGPGQNNWRYCSLCFCMFYDGFPTKGVCPANPANGHVASGYMFMLQHDVVDTGQSSWRYCKACFAMFYDGIAAKGACPARDKGHSGSELNFTLLHDIPDHATAGPAMVASNLEACGWLDPTRDHVGRDVGAGLRSRPAKMDLELIALRGSPQETYGGFFDRLANRGVFPVVGWGDDLMPLRPGERFLVEYRSRDGRDKGLPTTDLGAPGFLVMHALTGSGTSSSSVQISYMPVELQGTVYVEAAGLEVNILTFDREQGTVSVELKSDPWPPPPGQTNWRYCRKCHSLFYDGYAAKGTCPVGGAHAAFGLNFVLQHDVAWFLPERFLLQDQWRYCDKCFALYYDGFATSGHCVVQGHVARGFNFSLRHDVNDPGQDQWRYCSKCSGMFYNGFPTKGVCPQGGGHTASGFNFNLPHDVAGDGQDQWHYCSKCHGMFYNGFPTKGVCPQGGEHLASEFNFRLRHDLSPFTHAFDSRQDNWRFCRNCFGLFFEGFEPDGVCPAAGHRAQGYNFFLQHDSPGDGQDAWRFCSKCSQMYYDGFPTKGTCPLGGPHTAFGFDFRLHHR